MYFLVEEELYFRFQVTEVRLKNGLQSYEFLKTRLSTFCLNLSIDLKNIGEDDEVDVDDVDEEIGEESDVECDGRRTMKLA